MCPILLITSFPSVTHVSKLLFSCNLIVYYAFVAKIKKYLAIVKNLKLKNQS